NNKSVVSANSQSNKSSSSSSGGHSLLSIIGLTDFLDPKMNKAVSYLVSRDIDNDGLLEQDHNEDWMDSVMRRGKILYSNATWILALENYSNLLREFDMKKNDNQEQKKINGAIERLDRILKKAVQ